MTMDRSKFRHQTQVRVRNYEVDWQGIVHNANYLLYCEIGRVEYLKHLGIKLDLNTIHNENRVVLARNEIDYKSPAYFDELLTVFTRIIYIRNTSFAFESLVEESGKRRLVCENVAVHVWLHPRSGEPVIVSDEFRRIVRQFEGENVAIVGPTLLT
jgi:acyl-CoA thioester hydrolase